MEHQGADHLNHTYGRNPNHSRWWADLFSSVDHLVMQSLCEQFIHFQLQERRQALGL